MQIKHRDPVTGRWAKQGDRIEKMDLSQWLYSPTDMEIIKKLEIVIDVLNSLTEWRKKVEGYIWTGEYLDWGI